MVQGIEIVDGCIVDTNPATGEVIGRVPVSTVAEVNEKIAKAQAAQPSWALVPLEQRIAMLKAVCQSLAPRKEELASLMTAEMGKVYPEALAEMDGVVDKDAWLDLVYDANKPEEIENGLVVREAHGVVAVCSPWNFPADEALLLSLPALAAGNTVVLKPSEVVPMIGNEMAEALIAGEFYASNHQCRASPARGGGGPAPPPQWPYLITTCVLKACRRTSFTSSRATARSARRSSRAMSRWSA